MNIMKMNNKNNGIRPHRALVLQGGGALGAYEAGVLKRLAEILRKEDEQNGQSGRPLFDIVAGTSIGAVNASIIVNYVIKNKSWDKVENELYKFWDFISDPLWWLGDKKAFEDIRKNNLLFNNMLEINESFLHNGWDLFRTGRNNFVNFSKQIIDTYGSQSSIYFPVFYFKNNIHSLIGLISLT